MRVLLLLGVLSGALACDRPCLGNCFGTPETVDCLHMCGCEYPYSIAHFGGRVVTEDGREFLVQDIPGSELHYVADVYDCNLRCGQLCFRFTKGWNLLKCVDFCGCGMFVTETTARAQHPTVLLQEPDLPVLLQKEQIEAEEEGQCLQQCRVLCQDELCTTVCQADLCAAPVDSWSALAIFLGLFFGVLLCALCLAKRK